MPLSQHELLRVLKTGTFESLVGEFETEWLECKRQPYALDTDVHKLELAKDVSALANADGGVILIGFATKTDPTHGNDRIDRVRPFPLHRLDPDQYRKVIASWLWPPMEDTDVQLLPSVNDTSRGVAAITVPAASHSDRPILIRRTVLDSRKQVEILFGYSERKQARVTHLDAERLHRLLRDGHRMDSEIRAGFAAVHAALEDLRRVPRVPADPPTKVDERVQDALHVVGLETEPAFTLVSVPPRAFELQGLFQSRQNSLAKLIDDPPELRNAGFDLKSGDDSRIIGRLRRVFIQGYKLLEAHRDGLVVFIAPADGGGLCWGRRQRQQEYYLINQLFLVEIVYLFCRLVVELYAGQAEQGESILLKLTISRLARGNRTFLLEPDYLDRFGGLFDVHAAPSPTLSVETTLPYGDESPERWAVRLLAELYSQFGYEEDRIPYTRESEDGRVIDPEEIVAIR